MLIRVIWLETLTENDATMERLNRQKLRLVSLIAVAAVVRMLEYLFSNSAATSVIQWVIYPVGTLYLVSLIYMEVKNK